MLFYQVSVDRGWLWTFADLYLCIVNVRRHLLKIAHVEPFAAAPAFHE
jgi:hypothetical protein